MSEVYFHLNSPYTGLSCGLYCQYNHMILKPCLKCRLCCPPCYKLHLIHFAQSFSDPLVIARSSSSFPHTVLAKHGQRWMAKHQLDLMNLPATHPGLKEILVAELFSIWRTDNQFSRLPVDLTLEQTVNADAASRMT